MLGAVARHLARYPRWYAVTAAFVVGMALLPIVQSGGDAATNRSRPAAAARTVGGPPVPAPVQVVPDTGATAATFPVAAAMAGPAGGGAAGSGSAPAPPSPPAAPPPAGKGPLFHVPAPPAVPTPATPAALAPVLAALAPLVADGCNAIGLATLAFNLLSPSVPTVPVTDLIPYLVPVYASCALFPLPKAHTVCAIDRQVAALQPASTVGIYTLPPIIGLGIDEVDATAFSLSLVVGATVIPSPTAQLRAALGCT